MTPKSDPGAIRLRRIIGRNVKERRLAAGISERELAIRSGLREHLVVAMEAGKIDARLDQIVSVSVSLGVEPAALFEPHLDDL
jgi:transcriptional regulator with XRE-family HTH domain